MTTNTTTGPATVAATDKLIIIGSGPAGYTAAIYAARAGLAPRVIAGSVTHGGALMNTTEVENFPGFPGGIQGPELMAGLSEQAERFGAVIDYDDAATVQLKGHLKEVTTLEGKTYRAPAVIVATGSAYKELGLDEEKRLSGHGVSWCATCDGFFFRNQDIVVVGGGDSAMEEALFLTRFAASVTVVVRRDTLRASRIMAQRAKDNEKIHFAYHSAVTAIHGDDKVTGVTLTDTTTGATRDLAATGVFVAIGHIPRTELVAGQLELDGEGYITVDSPTTVTNLPGVFACGDAVDHRYRQAITAAGTGCAAALDAERYLAALEDAESIATALVEETPPMPETTTHTPDTAALPVVVIGAGPVGLAAAAHLTERGLTPLVLEAGPQEGAAIREWGHTRLFSPWRYNVDAAAARLLETQGWTAPDPEDLPTGAELVECYLQPLAGLLAGQIRTDARVVAVSRTGMDKTRTGNRETTPFLVRVQHPGGAIEDIRASAVIDASGTWATPNPLGQAGLPAPGEAEAVTAGRITAPLPDVTGRDRDRFTGRHVLVVGAGHSAANTLLELGALAETEPGTRISWAVRSADVSRVYGGEGRDELAARGALGTRLRRLVESGVIEVHTSFIITGFSTTADGLSVRATTPTGEEELSVDLLVPATGFRPNLGMLAELRLDLNPAVDAPRQLGPLIDPEFHSCGSVTPHGEKMLAHPEAGFYIVGMKSYGRAPTFLMATGYEQVRSITAALAGDRAAADDVQLELPETGVCSTDLGGSCDLPAPRSTDSSTEEQGCCAPAVAQEPADACCSGPQLVTIGATPVSVRSSCC